MRAAYVAVRPGLPLDVYARRPAPELPFPLEEPEYALFADARHALWQGVQALGLRPGDVVLTPALHAGWEVEALRRAGLTTAFYDAGPALEPEAAELERLRGASVRALYLKHHLGFPQDAARWQAWSEARGLYLLEDVSEAWLACWGRRPLGSFGHVAVFSLPDSFGLPDGGILLMRERTPGPDSHRVLGLSSLARRHALWLMERSSALATLGTGAAANGRRDLELGDPGEASSTATLFLLPRVAEPRAATARRAHYELLADELRDLVPAPFAELPEGSVPLGLPIVGDHKDGLRTQLRESGVAALEPWFPAHPSLPERALPGSAAWRARTLLLPVHQELAPSQLERIVDAASTRRRRPSLRLEHVSSLDDLREEWTELAIRSENVFATWEWASIWWRRFGGGRRLLVTACRTPTGRLVAILPLFLWSTRPLRTIRFLGHSAGDELGPICAPEDRVAVARALRQALERTRWDVFIGEHLPGRDWSALLGATTLTEEGSPVLTLDGDANEEGPSVWSSKLRKQLRYEERRLTREHDVRYRLADDPDRLADDLDLLFGLHTARWRAESSFAAVYETFHREFAETAFRKGWMRLWFLEIDGRAVAALYGLRFGAVESHYQGGRDPAWHRSSVGTLVLAHAIREAMKDGVREWRFLRGTDEYKYRFASHDPGLQTVAMGRGAVGRGALSAGTALHRRALLGSLRKRLAE